MKTVQIPDAVVKVLLDNMSDKSGVLGVEQLRTLVKASGVDIEIEEDLAVLNSALVLSEKMPDLTKELDSFRRLEGDTYKFMRYVPITQVVISNRVFEEEILDFKYCFSIEEWLKLEII